MLLPLNSTLLSWTHTDFKLHCDANKEHLLLVVTQLQHRDEKIRRSPV